jgi:hypothetical protein
MGSLNGRNIAIKNKTTQAHIYWHCLGTRRGVLDDPIRQLIDLIKVSFCGYDSNIKVLAYVIIMGRLLISRADSSAASARRHTTAYPTVVSRVLCTGYVVNKKLSCVLISKIWTQLQ